MGLGNREKIEELYGHEDDPDLYVALAFDPGGVTGWALLGVHPDAVTSGDESVRILDNVEFWTAGELSGAEDKQVDEMVELIGAWPSARLIIEDFILRKNVMSRELLAPVRLTAALEYTVRPRYFVKQQPALAMTTMTDDRLKAAGLWIPGKEHARDATRHALTFLKRQRERQIKAAAVLAG